MVPVTTDSLHIAFGLNGDAAWGGCAVRMCRAGSWTICWHGWEKTCFCLGGRPCRGQSVQLWLEKVACKAKLAGSHLSGLL